MNNELPSLPFFLDFRNLDEEKRKLQAEMQE